MKKFAKIAASIAVMLLLAWLLFKDTNWSAVGGAFREARWGWLVAACVPIVLSFFARVQRWSYIVRAVAPVTFKRMFTATQLCFLANFTIALRIGEFVRAFVLSRAPGLSFSKSIALSALDRVTDLFGLIAVVFIAAIAFDPGDGVTLPEGTFGNQNPITIGPEFIQAGAVTSLVGLVGIVAVLVGLYLQQERAIHITRRVVGLVSEKLADWLCGMFEQFAQGLHVFRSARDMGKSIGWSLFTWSLFLVSFQCFFWAFRIEGPFYTVFVVQTLLALAVSAPGVPGMVGQFHLPIVAGLLFCVPGLSADRAKAVAIAAHLCNLLPVVVFGVYSLHAEQLSFFKMAKQGVEAQDSADMDNATENGVEDDALETPPE